MLDVISLSAERRMLSRTIRRPVTVSAVDLRPLPSAGTGVIADLAWAVVIGVIAGTWLD